MKTWIKIWINTRVEFRWNGEKFVDTLVEGYWYEGPLVLAHDETALDVDIYRWRNDDGSETGASWLEDANTTHDFDLSSGDVECRLRVDVSESGGANASNQGYILRFSINSGGFVTLGAATAGVQYFDSSNLTNDNNTTEQLNGGGTFLGNSGQVEDGVSISQVIPANNDWEIEYTIKFIAADLSNTDTIDFQVLANGTDAVTMTVVPNATITIGAVSRNITANQTEIGDTQAAGIQVINQITGSQTEAGDIQTANISTVLPREITANQTEVGDTQDVEIRTVINEIIQSRIGAKTSDSTTHTLIYKIPPTEGNVLVAGIHHRNISLCTELTLTGWIEAACDIQGAVLRVFYKVAGASEPSEVTITANVAASGVMFIAELDGIDTTTPVNVSVVNNSGIDVLSLLSGDAITTQNITQMLLFSGIRDGGDTESFAFTNGFVKIRDQKSTGVGALSGMGVAYRRVTSTGTYNSTASWTDAGRAINALIAFTETTSGARNITANQTETGDSQVAALQTVVSITSSQSEVGDNQIATLQVINQINADQTEIGDSQISVVQIINEITTNQDEAGDSQTASIQGVASITADQTELGDTTNAVIQAVANINANQTELGDSQIAVIQVIQEITANQSEAGDTQSASIVSVLTSTITSAQTEEGDSQTGTLQVIQEITASQSEEGDVQTATIQVVQEITSNQFEAGDTQVASLISILTSTIAATQVEEGDSQIATIQIVQAITASQTEVGDSQASTIQVVPTVAANQAEFGDTQAAIIEVVGVITADQTEVGDVQTATILVGDIPARIITANQIELGDVQIAYLQEVPLLPIDVIMIGTDKRTFQIPAEGRTMQIPDEGRTIRIRS